jgi:2-oxoglutarate ferredoxin oxidoreductase subunit alpha
MEDEIASIAAVIGAAWTGKKAMTATSGPGFSLMMENLGFAVMTETPLVVVNVQRGGPSTGQPTLSAQGDMLQCRYGSHGDIAIIALSPSSVQEMYDLTVKAFNLAERFRCPVYLMADEHIGHMRERIDLPDAVEIVDRKPLEPGKKPFEADDDLVPGFPAFGRGYRVHVTGLTHDERGYPAATDPPLHAALVERLVRKVEDARHEIADYEVVNPDAEVVFACYGAPARSVQQLLADRPDDRIGMLRLRLVWPFPERALVEFSNATTFVVPEQNLGQMAREIERHVSVPVVRVPKIGGDLHTPRELAVVLEEVRGS